MDRQFLIFSSVGHKNNVHHWTAGKTNRIFDIVFYYYEDNDPPEFDADIVVKRKGFKLGNFAHYLEQNDISNYKAVWLVDDDMIIDKPSINKLFKDFIKYNLDLAQPAFKVGKKIIHFPFQKYDPSCYVKYTNFVENNACLVRGSIINLFKQSFKEAREGFGVDFIWPVLLGFPEKKIGIIHTVYCEHPFLEISALEEHFTREELRKHGVELLVKYDLLAKPNEPITHKHWKKPFEPKVLSTLKRPSGLLDRTKQFLFGGK